SALASSSTTFTAGDSRKSSTFALNDNPNAQIRALWVLSNESKTLCTSFVGRASLSSRANLIMGDCIGAAWWMNQGSTAMQCPPTPGPGLRICTRGWRFANLITSQPLIPNDWETSLNSLANAMFRSLKEFSASFVNSAVVASVTTNSPWQNVVYRSRASSEDFSLIPPIIRELLRSSNSVFPGITLSGQCAM